MPESNTQKNREIDGKSRTVRELERNTGVSPVLARGHPACGIPIGPFVRTDICRREADAWGASRTEHGRLAGAGPRASCLRYSHWSICADGYSHAGRPLASTAGTAMFRYITSPPLAAQPLAAASVSAAVQSVVC